MRVYLVDSAQFEGGEGSCGQWLREKVLFFKQSSSCWWEVGLCAQGAQLDIAIIRSHPYDAFGFPEAQLSEDVGEAQFVYWQCGIDPGGAVCEGAWETGGL